MKPGKPAPDQDDLLRARLVEMIDMRHELVKLEALLDRDIFEREWLGFFPSHTVRPATLPRLVAGLCYLQHALSSTRKWRSVKDIKSTKGRHDRDVQVGLCKARGLPASYSTLQRRVLWREGASKFALMSLPTIKPLASINTLDFGWKLKHVCRFWMRGMELACICTWCGASVESGNIGMCRIARPPHSRSPSHAQA